MINYFTTTFDNETVHMAKHSNPFNFPHFVKMLNEEVERRNLNAYVELKTTYQDYGARMAWETMIVYYKKDNARFDRWNSYQALYPRQWEEIDKGENWQEHFKEILDGRYGITHFCKD